MLSTPTIQLATAGDARAISEFSRDLIEYGLRWTYTQARILREIRSRTANVAVIREGGNLLAFGIMNYGDTAGHLFLFGVQPARRRRGLGRHLLTWLEECARTAGLDGIRVEARADNPGALAFYGSQGYQVLEKLPRYYGGALDGMRLEKSLLAPG